MYLQDILYKITDAQLEMVGIRNRADFFVNFKRHIRNILDNLHNSKELRPMFLYDNDDWNNIEVYTNFANIDTFVDYLYEENRIEQLYKIMPKVKSNLNDMILYHQLYLTSSKSFRDLMIKNGCTETHHTPGNYFIDGFNILGTGTFGTGLLLPNGKVIKITSDEQETYKDYCILKARKNNHFEKALIHLPEIYELGQLDDDFEYVLPTNGKILSAPKYSIKKYYDGSQKKSNYELNSIINDNEPYYKEFQNELIEFGNKYLISEWDIHSDNVCLTGDEIRFVYFDY